MKRFITACASLAAAWRRARELARLTAELRNLTRGHVYNYAREARIVRRIGELTR